MAWVATAGAVGGSGHSHRWAWGEWQASSEVGACVVRPLCDGDCYGASRPVGSFRGGAFAGGVARAGRRVVVANDDETTEDLMRDMIEDVTSWCACMYNRRDRGVRSVRAAGPESRAVEVG
jgi:hypothetical protein